MSWRQLHNFTEGMRCIIFSTAPSHRTCIIIMLHLSTPWCDSPSHVLKHLTNTIDDPPERTPSSGNYDSPKHPCAICGGDHPCYPLDLHEPISPWQRIKRVSMMGSPVGSRAPDFEVHWTCEWYVIMTWTLIQAGDDYSGLSYQITTQMTTFWKLQYISL